MSNRGEYEAAQRARIKAKELAREQSRKEIEALAGEPGSWRFAAVEQGGIL